MAYVDYVDHEPHNNIARGPPGSHTKLYACALLIIDGLGLVWRSCLFHACGFRVREIGRLRQTRLGHATWSSTMPISLSRTASF